MRLAVASLQEQNSRSLRSCNNFLWVLSGWQSVHIQLQPDYHTSSKEAHLCLEQDLLSCSPLVSQRGYLWDQLHGSKLNFIQHGSKLNFITNISQMLAKLDFSVGVCEEWRGLSNWDKETRLGCCCQNCVFDIAFWKMCGICHLQLEYHSIQSDKHIQYTTCVWGFVFPGLCLGHLRLAGDVPEGRARAGAHELC